MKEYNYYWYHHMLPKVEREEIQRAIDEKDYDTFIELYKFYSIEAIKYGFYDEEFETWFPMIFLPEWISVYNTETGEYEEDELVLTKSSFMKITFSESECG